MLTRDSWVLPITVLGGVLAFLSQMPDPRTWTYPQMLQAASAVVAIVAAQLGTSPLKGKPKG